MPYEDWEREEQVYSTHYPAYHPTGKRKKKSHAGLFAVLIVLVLVTGAVSWAVNFWQLHLEIAENRLSVVSGEEGSEARYGWQQIGQRGETAPFVQSPEQTQDTNGLEIHNTPQSVENRPVDIEGALSLQQIYEKVFPSVASISCVHADGGGTGTGIVMSHDGYVITNYHVIDNAQRIYVQLGEKSQYEAQLIGGDETTDLAVLKVEAEGLIPAEFGDSDMLRVGDSVVAIGDPLGTQLRGTMTDGIISAINRDLNLSGRQMTLIQTNAALNSGNSGGPLINCYGQVIGINTMKMSNYSFASSTVEGLGFAIPITQAKPILDELIVQGYVSGRPALGIEGVGVDLRAQLFYHLPSGVSITGLVEQSDAYEKGLECDDVIVRFNDTPIATLDDLVKAREGMAAGDIVRLTIFRGGRYYYVDVELMEQITPDIY